MLCENLSFDMDEICRNHIFFEREREINPNTNPQAIATDNPAATELNPPDIAPSIPLCFAPSIAPFARFEPKPIIGMVTPEPANCLMGSNAPDTSSTAPINIYKTRMRAEDILVLFIKI